MLCRGVFTPVWDKTVMCVLVCMKILCPCLYRLCGYVSDWGECVKCCGVWKVSIVNVSLLVQFSAYGPNDHVKGVSLCGLC